MSYHATDCNLQGGGHCDCYRNPELATQMRSRIEDLEAALLPFAHAVSNDNGDVTITPPDVTDYMHAKRVLANQK